MKRFFYFDDQLNKQYFDLSDLNERARSKAQRRLMAMALAHKRGELDPKYVNDDVKKLSELPTETLRQFAKTNEKKRRKDNTVGKRNAIPAYVEKKKKKKKKPKTEES